MESNTENGVVNTNFVDNARRTVEKNLPVINVEEKLNQMLGL